MQDLFLFHFVREVISLLRLHCVEVVHLQSIDYALLQCDDLPPDKRRPVHPVKCQDFDDKDKNHSATTMQHTFLGDLNLFSAQTREGSHEEGPPTS